MCPQVTAASPHTISAYRRFPRNALLSESGEGWGERVYNSVLTHSFKFTPLVLTYKKENNTNCFHMYSLHPENKICAENEWKKLQPSTSTYPSPKAKTWERKRDGMNTLRNSAEKMPPFFMAPLFLMLKETERLGCLKWNSLGGETQRG